MPTAAAADPGEVVLPLAGYLAQTGRMGLLGAAFLYQVGRWLWPQFLLCTAVGSAVRNGALIGAGVALGTQYELVERYVGLLDHALVAGVVAEVVAGVVAGAGWMVVRQLRRRGSTLGR